MHRLLICFLAAVAAMPLAAQPHAESASNADAIVAKVNGETITKSQLDQLWNRMSEKMRTQYMKSGGGKLGFLENYLRKRLVIQKATAEGFPKRDDVKAELEAAKEAALFDLYVREVIGSTVVTDELVRKFYDEHPAQFITRGEVEPFESARAGIREYLLSLYTKEVIDALSAETNALRATAKIEIFRENVE